MTSNLSKKSIEARIQAYQEALFYGDEGVEYASKFELWVAIGDLFSEVGNWTEAITSYQNARSLSETNVEVYYKLGNSLLKNGNPTRAVKAFQEAVTLQPIFPSAHLAMGNAFALENKIEQAIICYTTVIEQEPKSVEAYKNLSALFLLQGNQAGVACCDHYLSKREESRRESAAQTESIQPRAIAELPAKTPMSGEILSDETISVKNLVLPRPAKPNTHLDGLYQALSLKPNSAKSYVRLADALAQQGELNSAVAFYKIALKLKPTDFQIALQLRKCLDALSTAPERARITATPAVLAPPTRTVAAAIVSRSPTHSTAQPQTRLPGFPPGFHLPPPSGEGNDYTAITENVKSHFQSQAVPKQPYHLPVSIIIPTYNRKEKLAKVLAALIHQTYPQNLIEVIVADDGSNDGIETVIEKYQSHLDLVHTRQPDLGFRLAAVCNLGMQTAKHNFFIFLQCDMIPQPQVVEAYMQYFHVAENVFLIGGRQFVSTDSITDDHILTDIDIALNLPRIKTNNEMWQGQKSWQDWRLSLYEKTNNLKTERYPYRAVVGSNLAFSRQLTDKIGGFCEDFQNWGGEDREFGYRAYNAGCYFIPVREAQCLHQEPPNGINETNRRQGQKAAQAGCEAKCPLPLDRRFQPGRIYEVPKVSLFLIVRQTNQQAVQASIESALTQTHTDLELIILCDPSNSITQRLETRYARIPRVTWRILSKQTLAQIYAEAIATCNGPYLGSLIPGDILKPTAIKKLVDCLDDGKSGCVFGNYQTVGQTRSLKQIDLLPNSCRESFIQKVFLHRFYLFKKRDWERADDCFLEFNYAAEYDLILKLAQVCSFQHIDQVILNISQISPTFSPEYLLSTDLSTAQKQQNYLEIAKVANHIVKQQKDTLQRYSLIC